MGGFGGAIGNANFEEPSSPDTTSAPPMPDQTPAQQQLTPGAKKIAGSLASALAKRKKQGIGPTIKAPSELTAAIARARRARQSGEKYG
jgi:hypothetical protein